jgi:hypothetical protein
MKIDRIYKICRMRKKKINPANLVNPVYFRIRGENLWLHRFPFLAINFRAEPLRSTTGAIAVVYVPVVELITLRDNRGSPQRRRER